MRPSAPWLLARGLLALSLVSNVLALELWQGTCPPELQQAAVEHGGLRSCLDGSGFLIGRYTQPLLVVPDVCKYCFELYAFLYEHGDLSCLEGPMIGDLKLYTLDGAETCFGPRVRGLRWPPNSTYVAPNATTHPPLASPPTTAPAAPMSSPSPTPTSTPTRPPAITPTTTIALRPAPAPASVSPSPPPTLVTRASSSASPVSSAPTVRHAEAGTGLPDPTPAASSKVPPVAPNVPEGPADTSTHPNVLKWVATSAGVTTSALLVLVAAIAWHRHRQHGRVVPPEVHSLDPPEHLGSFHACDSGPVMSDCPTIKRHTERVASIPKSPSQIPWEDAIITSLRVPFDELLMQSLISRGGFGEVHRGTYRGHVVAVKTLLPERRGDLDQIIRFLDEVKLLAAMQHERIVRLIGVAWDKISELCVLLEFLPRGDLRALLDASPEMVNAPMGLVDPTKLQIAIHIAQALVYLHSRQTPVLHRDLKSRNVLLDKQLNAKLTDFGVSRERDDRTMTAGVGSSLWMAPEVMLGERYDEKADIFSFGVVLSELDQRSLPYAHAVEPISGRLLPTSTILQLVARGQLRAKFTVAGETVSSSSTMKALSSELSALGQGCVDVDPLARPTAVEIVMRLQQAIRVVKTAPVG